MIMPMPRHCEKAGSTAVEICVDAQAVVHEASIQKTPVLDVQKSIDSSWESAMPVGVVPAIIAELQRPELSCSGVHEAEAAADMQLPAMS